MKALLRCWITVLLFLTPPAVVHAQFTFTTNNGAITISGYTGSSGTVIIPGTTNGYPVTGIGNSAFSNKTSVANVTIPNTVIYIGTNAFYSCTGMTNITIGISVTNMGESAFFSCAKLASVTIPDSITNIGNTAFQSCTSLTNVIIGGNVAGIGYGAFQFCAKLQIVTLTGKVRNIESDAFFACNSLTNVIIGSNVISIAISAFESSHRLTAITVDANNPVYSSLAGVLFDKNQTTLIQYPEGLAGNYAIPNGVTNIGDTAFWFCRLLTNVTIPNGVIRIGNGSFQGASLTSIMIPANVTYVGPIAFNFCTALTNIDVDANNPLYSSVDGVLFNKDQNVLIQYPGGLAGSYAIPGGTTNIADYAFANCSGLTSVTVPDTVTSIGTAAFYVCTSLTNACFQGNAPTAGSSVFSGDNATVYYLPCTTGWGLTFCDVPTRLWLPQALTSDATFGLQTNQFGFSINWSDGMVVVVEACTNLSDPVWSPVSTNHLTGGSSYFSDSQWTNYPGRYYRLRSP